MSALPPGNEAEVEIQPEESVGQRLRAAREARNLPRAEVAAALHLGESIIEALEQDARDRLPGPVFVQGYLRKYARLLDMSEEPILEAYGRHHPLPRRKTNKAGLAGAPLRPEIRSNHAVVRLVTWFIVFSLLALVVTWWRGYLQWPAGDAGPAGESVELEAPLGGEPAGAESLPVLPGELVLEQDFRGPREEGPGPAVEAGTEAPPEAGTTVAAAPDEPGPPAGAAEEPPETPSAEPAVPPAEEAIPATAATEAEPAAEPLAPEDSIVIEFSSTCWTDIRDATGSYKLLGNMQMGERYVLGGEPPYSVILGNARAVTLTVKGQPYDVNRHARGNVARFTLQPEDIPDN